MQTASIPIAPSINLKKVLAATDFSYASQNVVPAAAALARRFHAELLVVHVDQTADLNPSRKVHARSQLATMVRSISGEYPQISAKLRMGDPASELLDLARAEHSDLIVVGTHAQAGLKHFLLGSVAEEIIRNAACPVLTMRTAAAGVGEVHNILVPTDLSSQSLRSVGYASMIAVEFGAKIHFLHVLPPETAQNPDTKELSHPLGERMRELTSPYVCPSCQPEYLLEAGDEAETIGNVARRIHADLVILAVRHGHPGNMLHSSLTYRVLCSSPCPVLTVNAC